KDLNDAVGILESKLRADPLLANVSADGALPRPELQVYPRKDEAARLGISRTPMREALRRLAADGLVVQQSPRVTVVADLDADDIRALFE
ncbi:GntR family transcriptional regulator, partial [Pseudomonas sp. BGM005]|nr:GntR family transcriptional regulator [Pseudomonas sp. BG5]